MYQFLRQACTNLLVSMDTEEKSQKQLRGVNIWLL